MGRIKSSCTQCRRERTKLFLKGERCLSPKCSVEKRKYPPGQHGSAVMRTTEYGRRMREKQKAKRMYGLTERQFRNYFERAARTAAATGSKLMELLERRLDNVVFRLGFAVSRQSARQLVHHGKISVNGKKVDVPSYQIKVNDTIALRPKLLERISERLKEYTPPSWLSYAPDQSASVLRLPKKDDTERLIEESAIVEYYSR